MSGISDGKVELDIRLIMAELGLDGSRFISELQTSASSGQTQSDTMLPNNGAHSYRRAML